MEQNAPHVSYKEQRRKNKASNHWLYCLLNVPKRENLYFLSLDPWFRWSLFFAANWVSGKQKTFKLGQNEKIVVAVFGAVYMLTMCVLKNVVF
jgi:hypothetical protein